MNYVILISEASSGLRPEDIASARARLNQQVDDARHAGLTPEGPPIYQPCGASVVLVQSMLCPSRDPDGEGALD